MICRRVWQALMKALSSSDGGVYILLMFRTDDDDSDSSQHKDQVPQYSL